MSQQPIRTGRRPAALLAAGLLLFFPAPAFAGAYWTGFRKWWAGFLGETDGVVLTVLVVGVISLIIITRGKWLK